MEKVKVSQRIADLIKNTKKKYKNHEIVEKYKEIKAIQRGEIDLDTLIRALYIGYEVEPDYKIGDSVFVNWNDRKGQFYTVEDVLGDGRIVIDNPIGNDTPNMVIVRHATSEEIAKEKERRWWAKHDRDVWQLKVGDVITVNDCIEWIGSIDDNTIVFQSGHWMDLEKIKHNVSIVCFVEDRKDA